MNGADLAGQHALFEAAVARAKDRAAIIREARRCAEPRRHDVPCVQRPESFDDCCSPKTAAIWMSCSFRCLAGRLRWSSAAARTTAPPRGRRMAGASPMSPISAERTKSGFGLATPHRIGRSSPRATSGTTVRANHERAVLADGERMSLATFSSEPGGPFLVRLE